MSTLAYYNTLKTHHFKEVCKPYYTYHDGQKWTVYTTQIVSGGAPPPPKANRRFK